MMKVSVRWVTCYPLKIQLMVGNKLGTPPRRNFYELF
jgi:hypothetical protein